MWVSHCYCQICYDDYILHIHVFKVIIQWLYTISNISARHILETEVFFSNEIPSFLWRPLDTNFDRLVH